MKNKILPLFIFIFFFPFLLSATHIIGGSLTYQQQGVSTYRITLKVYRDCSSATAFDPSITIEVLQSNGAVFAPSKNITINIGTITKLNPYVDTCVTKPNVCVEEAVYTKIVSNFPPFAGGYDLFWQRCCRNGSLLNIINPLTSGESFYAHIPDNNLLINNSSPTWVNSPPTFVCQGLPINFNHAATDVDGDALVYKFYDPYMGCDNAPGQVIGPNCPRDYPTFPGNVATFTPVIWNGATYSTNNPLGGAGLTLSPTGLLTGIPPSLGQFVVGIKCEEWRNGIKIGEILRDFQFNVVSCPPLANANFTSSGGCSGTVVTFTNTTAPVANTYFWNFGNTLTLADTSLATNPTYTYPALGTYTVTLIVNKGTACADTAIKIVYVSSVTANFTSNTAGCIGLPVTFKDGSTSAAGSSITNWSWKFGDAGTSALQNPTHIYNTAGTFTVTLVVTSSVGCKDSIKHIVTIQNTPVLNFTANGLCKGKTITFTNSTAPAANTYFWDFGDGTTLADTSLTTNPTYTYPATGTYTVTLTVNKGSACAITFKKTITLSSITANFTDNGPGCIGVAVSFIDGSTVSSNSSLTKWNWDFGDGGTAILQNLTHTYIASGTYNVKLVVTSAFGCKDSIIRQVVIQNLPNPNFNSTGLCNGKTIKFTNTTVPPGNSYFWDFGNITTLSDTSHSTNPTYTYPAIGTYTVTLVVNKGTACAITYTKVIALSSVTANFTNTTPGCKGVSVAFTNASTASSNSSVTNWNWDFGDTGVSTLQNPSHTYNSSGTYTVRLIVTSAKGCKDTITHIITIQQSPKANAGNDTTSCSNNASVKLTGTILNATGGTWVGSGNFNPNTTSLNPIYTPTSFAIANGKDTVLLISTGNGACPPDTDRVIITFYAGPKTNAGANIFVCKDTVSVPVCATITGALGGKWKTLGSGTFTDSLKACTSYIPSNADRAAGKVIVYITSTGNGNCLAARDSVLITFTATPTIVITSNDSTCANIPLPIKVTVSTGSGIWSSSGTGIFSPSNTTFNGFYIPSAADKAAGKVTLVFASTNNGGCRSAYDTIKLIILPPPTAGFTFVNACPSFPIVFTDVSTPAGSIASWKWTFGDGSPSSPLQNPSHVYIKGGPYNVQLIVTSKSGCSDTLTKKINLYENPLAKFNTNGTCLNDGTLFLDSSTVNASTIASWNWTFGDGTGSNLQNPKHTFLSSGNYSVTLIVKSVQGCIGTVIKTVAILPSPKANFSADKYITYVNQTINFTDQSGTVPAIASWLWNFGDSSSDSISTKQNPSHNYTKGGSFDVCLIITDIAGCRDTICHTVVIILPPAVPSGFTPNHDGHNDVFYVYGGPFKTLELKIYNNWGELIFESDKQSNGWDGTRNGVEQAIGVYVYTVVGTTEDDKEYKVSGDVTLLR